MEFLLGFSNGLQNEESARSTSSPSHFHVSLCALAGVKPSAKVKPSVTSSSLIRILLAIIHIYVA